MTVDEVKEELLHMEAPALREITTFILQLRRSLEPARKEELSKLIDSPRSKWLSLEEMEKRLGEE